MLCLIREIKIDGKTLVKEIYLVTKEESEVRKGFETVKAFLVSCMNDGRFASVKLWANVAEATLIYKSKDTDYHIVYEYRLSNWGKVEQAALQGDK